MSGPQYEWDPAKAASNLLKHRVSFEDAIDALEDPLAVIVDDNEPTEYRTRTIGRAPTGLLFVVTTDRDLDDGHIIVRIISAREATSREQTLYQRQALP
jgi:uncharacterized protein